MNLRLATVQFQFLSLETGELLNRAVFSFLSWRHSPADRMDMPFRAILLTTRLTSAALCSLSGGSSLAQLGAGLPIYFARRCRHLKRIGEHKAPQRDGVRPNAFQS